MSWLPLFSPLLGAVDPKVLELPQTPRNISTWRMEELLVVIAVLLALALALILWAVYIRKPKTDQTRTRIYKTREEVEERDDGTIRKKKRQKKQRRAHRTRNPTLSEAGGLPPARPDGPSPSI